jgi:mannose-6-phosphate isomerase-like protein (cupin superfamily)
MKRVLLVLALLAVPTWASRSAAPADFVHWPAARLQAYARELATRIQVVEEGGLAQKVGVEQRDFPSHRVFILHREQSSLAELHEQETDFYVVESGRATMEVGGEIVDARSSAPGEIRGTAIEGGQRTRIEAGDVVNVPAGMPHRVLVEPGEQITYLIVKIRS